MEGFNWLVKLTNDPQSKMFSTPRTTSEFQAAGYGAVHFLETNEKATPDSTLEVSSNGSPERLFTIRSILDYAVAEDPSVLGDDPRLIDELRRHAANHPRKGR